MISFFIQCYNFIYFYCLFSFVCYNVFFFIFDRSSYSKNEIKKKKKTKNVASLNGHAYSTFIGPLPSSGSSPGLPLTLDNNSCTPTPLITTTTIADTEDGTNTTTTMNKYEGTIDSIMLNYFS